MGASLPIKQEKHEGLFLNWLPKETHRAFLYCAILPLFKKSGWYLAGGTALALQVGHRTSVDLDFFTRMSRFRQLALERSLLETGKWHTSYIQTGTVYGVLDGAKTSFIAYPFFVPMQPFLRYGFLRVLVPSDVAAMKIIAISQRGRKRDFIDLYWYCVNREPLQPIIERAVRQYPGQRHNIPHFIKSLTYFVDAEDDPMPKLFFDATWSGIKSWFRREVPRVARELLRI